ncbi:MAG: hypothetical protein LBD81_00650 [Holosporaceae bacterium]|jgi:hypothetical protein|nr:hypothetical protein [Holosporaceae bacterium]
MIKHVIAVAMCLLLSVADGMIQEATNVSRNIEDISRIQPSIPRGNTSFVFPQNVVPVKTILEKFIDTLCAAARIYVADRKAFLYSLINSEGTCSRIVSGEEIFMEHHNTSSYNDNMLGTSNTTRGLYLSMAFVYDGRRTDFFKWIYKNMRLDKIVWDDKRRFLSCPLNQISLNLNAPEPSPLMVCARSILGEFFIFPAKEIRFKIHDNIIIEMFPSAWDPDTNDWIKNGYKLVPIIEGFRKHHFQLPTLGQITTVMEARRSNIIRPPLLRQWHPWYSRHNQNRRGFRRARNSFKRWCPPRTNTNIYVYRPEQ